MYLKGGIMDGLLYRFTMGLTVFGKAHIKHLRFSTLSNLLRLKNFFGTASSMTDTVLCTRYSFRIHVKMLDKAKITHKAYFERE